MKHIAFFLLVAGCMICNPGTLSSQERMYVGTGDTLNIVLSSGFQYLYPDFTQGRVHFTTGEVSTAFMNYNILMNEIHFFDSRRLAMLELKSEADFLEHAQSLVMDDIEFVTIGKDVFFNTTRGLMILVANYDIKLLQQNSIRITGESKVGAYGQRVQSASIESRDRLPVEMAREADLKPRVETQFTRKTEYFLYDDGRLVPATQRQFERNFPERRSDIRSFVSANKTDFSNMDDLKKLLEFCFNQPE